MKNTIYGFALNVFFTIFIVVVVVAVSTVSLTRKINSEKLKYEQGIAGVVIKEEVSILGIKKGFVGKLEVKEGQKVKKGDLLVEISDPLLEAQVEELEKFPDNVSAQTQSSLAQSQLDYSRVISPIDGVVGKVAVSVNSRVDEYSELMVIYANENTKLLAYLTLDQYLAAQRVSRIPTFSPRLNQEFILTPDILKPDQEKDEQEKTNGEVALYLKLVNEEDSVSLLNGESLQLRLYPEGDKIVKPFDLFVNFWNGVLN